MASESSSSALKRRARRKFRALPTVGAVALLAGLALWGWMKTHPATDPNSKLLTAPVTRGDLVETISATGSVTAQTGAEVHIGSQITGTIKHLYADVGTHVTKGQIIAELDLPDLEAQVNQAKANLAQAQTRLEQQKSGILMQQLQTRGAVDQANASLRSMQSKLASSEAAARQQTAQTPTDIARAQTNVAAMQAALSTAQSNLKQVQASANLQVATAQETLTQARATAQNSALDLQRQQELLAKGFVAASVVDTARATNTISKSQVSAAEQNVQLIKEKVAADLQSARDQVTQAQQNVEAARAALAGAQAETYLDRAKLADVNDAREQVRQSQANLSVAKGNTAQDILKQQDVAAAAEAVRQAMAQLDYNEAQMAKSFIRSPISGTVLQLASQQGETLAAGLSAPTLIIVADLNRLQVDAFVDETDIGKVRLGQEADITVDAFPKKVFKGKIIKIASGSTIQQNVVTYDVTITIDDKRRQLKPDMTASVTVRVGTRQNVLLVPSEAVKVGVRGTTVNVLAKQDGKTDVAPRKVRTGASDGVNTEIREGLKEGETIVLAGMDNGQRRGPASPFGPSGGRGGGGGGGRGGR
jgi:RND family efflux transporter MFP subunit